MTRALRSFIPGALLAASFLAAGPARAAVSTDTVTSVTLSTTTGLRTSIALDSRNGLHIAYYDPAAQKVNYVSLLNGSSAWGVPSVVGDAASTIHSTSTAMALDSSQNPHIVFYDAANHKLKRTHLSGAVWLTDTIDTFVSADPFPSIIMGPNNRPRVLYNNDQSTSTVMAVFSGVSWSTFTVFAATMAAPGSIALDAAGQTHIAVNLNLEVFVSTQHVLTYFIETAPSSGRFDGVPVAALGTGSDPSGPGNVSMALSAGGSASISAFFEGTGSLAYFLAASTSAAPSFGIITSGGVGQSNAIVVNASGLAFITSSVDGGGLRLYTQDAVGSTSFTPSPLDAAPSAGGANSITLNAYGHVFASYMALTPGALKFATNAPRGLSIDGTVRDSLGAGLPGVTMVLTGNIAETGLAASGAGAYTFTNLLEGAYTVTPERAGYGFLPDKHSYAPLGVSVTSQDFLGGPVNFSELDNLIDPTKGQVVTMNYSILGGHVVIEVDGLNGRKIKTLADDDEVIGSHSLTWDGRNERGEAVASGIYLVQVRGAGLKQVGKVAVVK